MNKITKSILIAATVLVAAQAWAATPREILSSLKQSIAPDRRTAVWDVKAVNQKGTVNIVGTVGTNEQKEAVSAELEKNGITKYANNLIVLENSVAPEKKWALVKLGIASLRCEGDHAAEMATQAVMGTPVKVLEYDDWCRVVTPDNYISYVPSNSLTFCDEDAMAHWRVSPRYIVTTYCTRLVTEPKGDETITDLTMGCILEYKGATKKGDWIMLATPDGRVGYVEKESVQSLDTWKEQPFNAALIEKTARRMMGSGYLWGGTSTKVTDCSGLSKISYFSNGIILQRDASQQALYGEKIKDWHDAKLGDLLFFGNQKTGRVTHVGIYLRDGKYIHCSGQVKVNSLDPNDPLYLYPTLSISRVDGMIGTKGITTVALHKWYYNQ